MSEVPALFGRALVGVVGLPDAAPAGLPAWILLNAGVVHRVGPGRLSVRLARRLRALGHVVARFDHGGVGDSLGGLAHEGPATWIDATTAETRLVMDALEREHGSERFVLCGLCSGATTAFWTASRDPRVAGVALLNAQALVPDAAWNERVKGRGWTRTYLRRSLRDPASWRRALTGRVGYARLARVLARAAGDRARRVVGGDAGDGAVGARLAAELDRMRARGVRVLWLCADDDHSRDYLAEVTGRCAASVDSAVVARADHTFTLRASQAEVVERLAAWARGSWPEGGA